MLVIDLQITPVPNFVDNISIRVNMCSQIELNDFTGRFQFRPYVAFAHFFAPTARSQYRNEVGPIYFAWVRCTALSASKNKVASVSKPTQRRRHATLVILVILEDVTVVFDFLHQSRVSAPVLHEGIADFSTYLFPKLPPPYRGAPDPRYSLFSQYQDDQRQDRSEP